MIEREKLREINRFATNLDFIIKQRQSKELDEGGQSTETTSHKPTRDRLAEKITMSRRRFFSRGFLSTALVLGGSARVSRSMSDFLLENGDKVTKLPDQARQIPHHLSRLPGYAQSAAEEAVDAAAKSPRMVPYTYNEFKNTRFISIECKPNNTKADKHIHSAHWGFDLPFLTSGDEEKLCASYGHGQLVPSQNGGVPSEAPQLSKSNTKGDLVGMGLGLGIAVTGWKIANSPGVKHEITRRKFLSRIRSGIIFGVMSNLKIIDNISNLISENLDHPES